MLLHSLPRFTCNVLAIVMVAGPFIGTFSATWVYVIDSLTIEKSSRISGATGDLPVTHSETLLRVQTDAMRLVSPGRGEETQQVAADAIAIVIALPQPLRTNIALPEPLLHRPVEFVERGAGLHKSASSNLHRQEGGARIPVNRLRPDRAQPGNVGALQRISVLSHHSTLNVQPGGTTASAVVFNALELAQEVRPVSDAQIARLTDTFGPVARGRLTQWRALVSNPKNRAAAERHKLELFNDFMNRTPFKTDREHWGVDDYWAMPIEFLSSNGGDCEDFAIAKYFTLRALGVAEEKLQITYVKEINLYNRAHMVLAYYPTPDAEPLILDSANKTIQSSSSRTDLVPVYSFNGSGLWLAKDQSGRSLQGAGSSERIVLWKELLARMKNGA